MKVSRNTIPALCLFALAVVLQAGCATTSTTSVAAPDTNAVAGQSKEPLLSGKVVETMDSGNYTYMNLENNGQKKWVAVPASKVEVGQEVKLKPGNEMGAFTSKTLKRTFDNIIFTEMATDTPQPQQGQPAQNATMPKGHPAMGQQMQMPQGQAPAMANEAAISGTISGKVVETMDSSMYTYVNLEMKDKTVWVAMPTTKVTVGQELEVMNGAEMKNIKSKGLNRTFDSIIFSGGPVSKK
jgi:hypothetical protein